jgi:uncharacterized protein (DUF736 family)
MRPAAEDLPAFRLFIGHSQIAAAWEQGGGSMPGYAATLPNNRYFQKRNRKALA